MYCKYAYYLKKYFAVINTLRNQMQWNEGNDLLLLVYMWLKYISRHKWCVLIVIKSY